MNFNFNAMIDCLKRERQIHEQLLLAKREEQRLLALGDAVTLVKLIDRLEQLTQEASRLETERMDLTSEAATAMGLMTEGLTLVALASRLPKGIEREELESLGAALRDMAQEIQQINHANARILERTIDTLNREISTLADQPESRVYSHGGSKPRKDAPRAGLNLKG